ncbi:MAG TPA: glycoside hydrolase family 38 C-terminal domain-containing protein [Vicinamibacterales bacterium]|jgi:alpha-mannosidase
MKHLRRVVLVLIGVWLCTLGVHTQQPQAPPAEAAKPTLYLVSNSHLDTQWNWTVQDTIRELVPASFYDNFKLFERFPHYVFNFEGAIHYMWFKEYHPDAWPTLQKYVADGRWKLSGSWINAVDTNVPSPEALMRQALYGKRFYRQEFNKVSQDIYLPDCFGFGFALPSIGAHSGLKAFSTQKLTWGAAKPTPFAIGWWKGVDGNGLVASIRPGDYVKAVTTDISTDPKWNSDLTTLGDGAKVSFKYFGVGDQGGAPDAASVEWVERAIANTRGAVQVRNVSADQLSRDLTDVQRASLPTYEGELLLKTHGVGCYTSQAAMKTWNRRNELLADAAERASLAAEWLGGPAYPRDRLRTAWTRFLWHQFHDDLTGTSIPQAYQFSWNDELISLNQFASILTGAAASVASGLDTRSAAVDAPATSSSGIPLVVYNPLAFARKDVVEATVQIAGAPLAAVRVIDLASGQDVPAQVLSSAAGSARVLFLAEMSPVSFKVFEARRAAKTAESPTLKVGATTLENSRYAVKLDANGDVSSITDKESGTELLKGPSRLELFDNPSFRWPAWEILWDTVSKPPREFAKSPTVRIVERGPARVAIEVTRKAAGSTFIQQIRLAEGGDRVDFDTRVDWRSAGTLLKASFPLAATNPNATYDLGLGTFERGNATAGLYEVPAQQWADLTDASGRFGVAILNDAKYGWDKPTDNELRLTLIHTPMPGKNYVYQSSNDIGHHHFTYSVAGHSAGWREGRVPLRAARLNQPLVAFQTAPHAGPLGRTAGLLDMPDVKGQVAVRAFKKAEDTDEIVLRVQELYGRPVSGLEIGLPAGIQQAREINGAEEKVGPATVSGGKLVVNLKPYQPRTFALTPKPSSARVPAIASAALELPFNVDGISTEAKRADGDFDGHGRTYPAEQMPELLQLNGVTFKLGPTAPGAPNTVATKGQKISLPAGSYNRLYLVASAVDGDAKGTVTIERKGGSPVRVPLSVQDWAGAIGQWDSRLRDDRMLREVFVPSISDDQSWPLATIESQMLAKFLPPARPADKPGAPAGGAPGAPTAAPGKVVGLERIRPGYVKRDDVAWVATHRHTPDGNEPYIFGYLFAYAIDLPAGATAVVLPENTRIRIFAASVASDPAPGTRPAGPLYAQDLASPVPAAAPAAKPATANEKPAPTAAKPDAVKQD